MIEVEVELTAEGLLASEEESIGGSDRLWTLLSCRRDSSSRRRCH